jgi:hypothetical protein
LGLNAVALLKKDVWPDGKIKIGSSKKGAVQFERCTASNFVCSTSANYGKYDITFYQSQPVTNIVANCDGL